MGESWEVLSGDLTKADPATLTTGKGGDGNIQYATITTLSESPLQPGLIWVGTDDGNVQVTRDDGESWTLVNDNVPHNPEYWVSRVEASHHDPGTAYLSYTGMRRDDFRVFIYKTTDFGESWTDISSNLPEEPVNVIREHHQNPNLLFVGTDFGVYVSLDGGLSWMSMKNNMPTQPAYDMKIHPRENDLIVATHGRGIYIADISALSQVKPEILEEEFHFFQPESKIRWIGSDLTSYASNNFEGESEPLAIPFYYHLRSDAGSEVTFTVYRGNMAIATVEGPGSAGLHKVAWDMNKTPADQASPGQEGAGARPRRNRPRVQPAPLGEYTVVMSLNGAEMARKVSILKDEWWMTRR